MGQKTKADLLLTKFVQLDGDIKNRSIKERHLGVFPPTASGKIWTSTNDTGYGYWGSIAPVPDIYVPSIFSTFGGDGSDGSKTLDTDGSSNFSAHDNANNPGIAQYTTLNITVDDTLVIDTGFAYIGVSGTCTIAGTINADGQGGTGGAAPGLSTAGLPGLNGYGISSTTLIDGCLAGGGGGGGADVSSHAGGAGGGAGGTGGAGGSPNGGVGDTATAIPALKFTMLTGGDGDNTVPHTVLETSYLVVQITGGGGGSGAGDAGGDGGAGGNGGGVIYIECDTLVFTGTLTADGVAGSNGAGSGAGGGGGGSGCIFIRAKTLDTNTGTTTITAGGAGTGPGTGGNGGVGVVGFKDIIAT